jgi:hypothetical protein
MTEYVARHELNSIAAEIERLESQGAVEIKAIPRRDATFRGLIKQGVHKGEAEAIAWILSVRKDLRPLFVSRDERAVRTALSHTRRHRRHGFGRGHDRIGDSLKRTGPECLDDMGGSSTAVR